MSKNEFKRIFKFIVVFPLPSYSKSCLSNSLRFLLDADGQVRLGTNFISK